MKDLRLGDKVESIINATVPKKIVDAVKSLGCGCQKRKDWLNGLTLPERLKQLEDQKREELQKKENGF